MKPTDVHCMCLAIALAPTAFLCACAVPATEVAVPTMPMRQALALTRIDGSYSQTAPHDNPRPATTETLPPAKTSLVSAPDIRLGYLYEWVDPAGNKHYGEWVAIPIAGYKWIMSDGTHAPFDPANPDPPQIPEGR